MQIVIIITEAFPEYYQLINIANLFTKYHLDVIQYTDDKNPLLT